MISKPRTNLMLIFLYVSRAAMSIPPGICSGTITRPIASRVKPMLLGWVVVVRPVRMVMALSLAAPLVTFWNGPLVMIGGSMVKVMAPEVSEMVAVLRKFFSVPVLAKLTGLTA